MGPGCVFSAVRRTRPSFWGRSGCRSADVPRLQPPSGVMTGFRCVTITSAHLAHPGLATATVRAGGVGVLDLEWCPPGDRDRAFANLARLCAQTDGPVGLRLSAGQLSELGDRLEILAGREHWLLVADWQEEPAWRRLAANPARRLWLELTALDQLAEASAGGFDGWLARGSEVGGTTGRETLYVLAQGLATQERPFLAHGAIGPHSAAACRALGAAGVVLDDQLLLMPESPLPVAWRGLLAGWEGDPTATVGQELVRPLRLVRRPELPWAASWPKRRTGSSLPGAVSKTGRTGGTKSARSVSAGDRRNAAYGRWASR